MAPPHEIDASNQVSTFHLLSPSAAFHFLSTNVNQWDPALKKFNPCDPAAARFEPTISRSNTWWIRSQDHGALRQSFFWILDFGKIFWYQTELSIKEKKLKPFSSRLLQHSTQYRFFKFSAICFDVACFFSSCKSFDLSIWIDSKLVCVWYTCSYMLSLRSLIF